MCFYASSRGKQGRQHPQVMDGTSRQVSDLPQAWHFEERLVPLLAKRLAQLSLAATTVNQRSALGGLRSIIVVMASKQFMSRRLWAQKRNDSA